MQGDDPPYLPVGTAVSAKYKGAFCEAKVSKVVRCVKCKITYKMGLGTATVTDEQIRGPLRVGHIVQARHSEKKEFIEATITKIQDCSQYTVVFDDGDITTLRRTALCLKSGRHFNESETLDQLPLTHPEHFGNPVVGGRRGRRSRQLKEDSSDGEAEEDPEPDLFLYREDIGKVVCVEGNDKKKSRDNWFPGLVVVPSAQPTVRINVREEYLVRSFKDGRYYTVPKKEISEFSRDLANRVESTALSEAMEKALRFLDRKELPVHWERSTLFNMQLQDSDSDENCSDSSDDEPREEKDHFVAQLYKFMDDRGTPLNKSPMIGNRHVDLYRLFRVVSKLGGYNRVTNQSKWRSVAIRLGYQHNTITYNSVKQAYKKYLFSFEEFYRKLGCTMNYHSRNVKKHRGRSLIRDRDRATPVNCSPRPDRSDDTASENSVDKKEEIEKIKAKSETPKPKTIEKEINERLKKKENILESSDSNSINSSDGTIDVQSDSGQGTSKQKDDKKKIDSKLIKDRKIRGPIGDKVKALVEHFEEHSKKENSKEEDKIQQTRSKSTTKNKDNFSPERKDVLHRNIKTPKKQEEDKRRGRKRKETESDSKSQSESNSDSSLSSSPVNIGDKLKVYYGPTHESKVTYEAKVLDINKNSSGIIYRVHYTGWNTRYDEWIKPARIAENLSVTTKAKRLKQSQTSVKLSPKPTGKRGRGQSMSTRVSTEVPPRSTTPSSVTSSSSRTKSPATPAGGRAGSSRITRHGGDSGTTNRRTRRTSAHTDMSIPSESESEQSESESELTRTRSGSKIEEPRKKVGKKKEEDDTEKDDDGDKPKRYLKRKKSPDPKSSTPESDDDSSSPPKGRDFDLNQIRSELKGFEKAVKITTSESASETPTEEKAITADIKTIIGEKKSDEKIVKVETKLLDKSLSTDDIYEFKEPEPFEFETRTSKLNEEKIAKKRLPRLFEDLEKTPKKKGGRSPPKIENKELDDKKRSLKRTSGKKTDDDEEKSSIKEESSSTKPRLSEDPFDKLVESPSFNIGQIEKKPTIISESSKAKVVKTLNLDDTLSLFKELPETIGEDSSEFLRMPPLDDSPVGSPMTRKELTFPDSTFNNTDPSTTTGSIFRGFTAIKCDDDNKKRVLKDGASDEDDSITAAIQRAISHTMTDEDSTGDDLFITQPTCIYQPKLKSKEENKSQNIICKNEFTSKDAKEPLSVNIDLGKDTKDIKVAKISPNLLKSEGALLESTKLQAEALKKEESSESQTKVVAKIAESILQKLNMIKKTDDSKPVKIEEKSEGAESNEVIVKSEIKIETEIMEHIEIIKMESPDTTYHEIKKRPNKKVVSRQFIDDSDTDSSDSEERLVIARSDDDSQTNPSDKLDFKDTDSNVSALQAQTDDSQEEQDYKFQETAKADSTSDSAFENPEIKQEAIENKEEEPDSNISLLLCKETIPGSPAPIPEAAPVPTETRNKPKSAKSLLLEMPFASAPGSSNSKPMLTNPIEHPPQQQKPLPVAKSDNQPLAVPLDSCTPNEESSTIDNSPPATPESTISNLSPRGDQDRTSPNTADNESCKSSDSGQRTQTTKITAYNEEAAKKSLREETVAPCRKRRRSCKASDDVPVKRGRKPRHVRANSDSDDTSEHSAPSSTPPTHLTNINPCSSLSAPETRFSSRSPRPSKYNFIIDLDPSMECSQRISLLQQSLSELRKTYNNVKTELACIDRRRKKIRRREREALKAAKQEMACS